MAMLRTPTLLLALALTSACASSGGAGADADAAVETPQSSGKAEQAAVDLRIAELELKRMNDSLMVLFSLPYRRIFAQ